MTVVRSGPDTQQMRPIYPEHPRPADGINLVYLGIMGPQDGVDQVLLVVDELVHTRGRTNVTATLLGFGDCLEDLKAQSTALGLDDHVTFTGRVDRVAIAEYLSRADIGLCPDLKTPLNDLSTMNKTMEYMAYALPAVSFDLVETRVSGGDTVLYVPSGDIAAFADPVERLIDDPDAAGRARPKGARARVDATRLAPAGRGVRRGVRRGLRVLASPDPPFRTTGPVTASRPAGPALRRPRRRRGVRPLPPSNGGLRDPDRTNLHHLLRAGRRRRRRTSPRSPTAR